MVVRRRKKREKMRGSKFHGFAKKKHRGRGSKGGSGMAGAGKRSAHKKFTVLKEYGGEYFGKVGFSSIMKIKEVPINIRDLPDQNEIDLTKLGYTKLLGKGEVSRPVKIIVKKASKSAVEKIKNAKGDVIIK